MKKEFIILVFSIFMGQFSMANNVWDGTSEIWTKGSGTAADPYIIEKPQNLAWISEMTNAGLETYSGKSFKLSNDLDMNNVLWTPTGTFSGTLNGNNHKIMNLRIEDVPSQTNYGLFGHTNNAYIHSLTINANVYISSGTSSINVGALCGNSQNSVFDSIKVVGEVKATLNSTEENLGGLIGCGEMSLLSYCYIDCKVKSTASYQSTCNVGGVVGKISNSSIITLCTNNDSVVIYHRTEDDSTIGHSYKATIGGIVGNMSPTTINSCGNNGHISSTIGNRYYTSTNNVIGGVAGCVHGVCEITKSYNIGNILSKTYGNNSHGDATGVHFLGGLIGDCCRNTDGSPSVTSCYNRGTMLTETYQYISYRNPKWNLSSASDELVRGIASGWVLESPITNCYTTRAGYSGSAITNSYYVSSSYEKEMGIQKSESAMKSASFPIILNGQGDAIFKQDTYGINDGFPVFAWQVPTCKLTVTSNDLQLGTVEYTSTHEINASAVFSAKPNNHCHFVEWNDGNTTNPRTITITKDTSFIATFAKNTYTITTNATNGIVTGGGSYTYGNQVTLTATPNEHYHFVKWSDGNVNTSRNITVTEDISFTAEFAIDQFTISASGVNGAVNGAGTYDYGTQVTLTAVPNAHYHFVQWNDGNTNVSRSITTTEDITFTAEFAIDQFTITTNGENGTVTGCGTYNYGNQVVLTATANEHYNFVNWSDGVTTATRVITVSENKTYTANFALDQFTISATGLNGTISGTGTYDYGTLVTLSATANEHYHFVKWSDGETNASRVVQVTQNASFTAEFAIDQHTITVVGENGIVTGGGTYDYGKQVTLTATANQHYHFSCWSDSVSSSTRTITVSGNATYTAIFVCDQYTITAQPLNAKMGSVTGSGDYDYNSEAVLVATPEYGYEFVKWSDNNTENPRLLTVTKNAQYYAIFAAAKFTITVLSMDDSQGVVTGSDDYSYNTQATITATANEGYVFDQWTDGNTDNPRTILVTEDATLIATFVVSQTTDVDEVMSNSDSVQKIIKDGQLYILRDGKMYNSQGTAVE